MRDLRGTPPVAFEARRSAAPGGAALVRLLVDEPLLAAVPQVLAAARAASPGPVVVVRNDGGGSRVDLLLEGEQRPRAIVLADGADAARSLCRLARGDLRTEPEVMLAGDAAEAAGLRLAGCGRLHPADAAWLGRLIARTRIGLALGAGGARGWAHVGALEVLLGAGYTIDAISGTSIGAIAGTLLAAGQPAWEIEAVMRRLFSAENVRHIFRLSLAGTSSGRSLMIELLRHEFGELRLDQLRPTPTVMAVNLDTGCLEPLRSGAVWQALAAATALTGMFAPWPIAQQRMIDALPLAPLPVDHLTAADVAVAIDVTASVDELLPDGVERAAAGPRLLAALSETIELVAAHAAARERDRADVVIRPQLGHASWKDFSLADHHREAGCRAARAALPALAALAGPPNHRQVTKGALHAVETVHA